MFLSVATEQLTILYRSQKNVLTSRHSFQIHCRKGCHQVAEGHAEDN